MDTIERRPRFLTVKEFAAHIGAHPNTIYRMVARKRLPHSLVGERKIMIPEDALERGVVPIKADDAA